MKNGRTTMIKRIFAVTLAFAVAVSILTVPVQEAYAAGGKVKTVAVTNLPAKQLTLKKGKTFTLKSKVTVTRKASKKVTYKTSNKKIATVNAKGKITAKKKGTAKIYVISKADKKKKCTITVTVGTPVTKVKLNKTKSTMTIGKKQTLKATVTPKKASSKAVVWKSSNKKVATVTSKGVVKAKKEGTVTITATAKDGSGKKATCKITVKKAASIIPIPTPEEPLIVKNMNIEQPNLLAVTFTKPVKLTAADFQVWAKKYESADYRKQYPIGQVTTTDSLTYRIELTGDMLLQKDCYVKAAVPKLNLSKECIYMDDTYTVEDTETLAYETGTDIDYKVGQALGKGYSDYSISGLPDGIQYKVAKDASKQTLTFIGNIAKAGKYTSRVTYADELGNKFSKTIKWIIYDETQIFVKDTEYALTNARGIQDQQLKVYGGNGSGTEDYIYDIVPEESDSEAVQYCKLTNNGRTIDISATKMLPGTYKLCIRATDKTDPSLTGTGIFKIKILEGYYLHGIVRDGNGDPMEVFSYVIRNQDPYAECSGFLSGWVSTSNEKYAGKINEDYIGAGIYDVTVSNTGKTTSKTIYNLSARKNAAETDRVSSFDITLPVYKVQIQMSPDAPEELKDYTQFDRWYNNGCYVGKSTILYLENGTYKLENTVKVNGKNYKICADVTVDGKTTTAYAYVEE